MNGKHMKRLLIAMALAMLSLVASGCIKLHLSINVCPDGSGTIVMAIGMTQEARVLIASQGGDDPMTTMSQAFGGPSDAQTKRWTEGGYEWVEGTIPFVSPRDLNSRIENSGLLRSFQLTRRSDLFKVYHTLDTELDPWSLLAPNETEELGFGLDPSAMFDMQLFVTLPGKITETNGISVGKDSNTVSWVFDPNQATAVHIASESWNRMTIGAMAVAGIAIAFTVLLIATFIKVRLDSMGGGTKGGNQ